VSQRINKQIAMRMRLVWKKMTSKERKGEANVEVMSKHSRNLTQILLPESRLLQRRDEEDIVPGKGRDFTFRGES